MADRVGWRSFWWLNVGLLTLTVIMCVFGLPETKWHRVHPGEVGHISNNEKTAAESSRNTSDEHGKTDTSVKEVVPDLTRTETAAQDPSLGKGSPSKQQFKILQPKDTNTSILNEILTPWKLLAFPIVELASFIVSWSASCFLTLNLTQAQNFAAPPYLYSSEVIGTYVCMRNSFVRDLSLTGSCLGFFNFAILVGAFIGLATAGPLSDWISMKLTIRNKGIREPEMRLLAMLPYICVMILGNVITAVGYEHKWSWKVCHQQRNVLILFLK